MKTPILTLRLSRRAIGAAVLSDERLTLADGRHLTSRRERATVAAERYLQRLLSMVKPGGVVVEAPGGADDGSTVASTVVAMLRNLSIDTLVIGRPDVLAAYGVRPRRARPELRALIASFWPELDRIQGRVQPYVADAAAAALYAESRLALSPPPT